MATIPSAISNFVRIDSANRNIRVHSIREAGDSWGPSDFVGIAPVGTYAITINAVGVLGTIASPTLNFNVTFKEECDPP